MLVLQRLARFGVFLAALTPVSAVRAAAPPVAPPPERPLVVVCRLDSEVHPAAADFLKRSIRRAEEEKAALLVIELSTPGGLMTSTREITTAILNSKVPVATFVSPSGAPAASAGFFLLLAGDVAAMAPGTNTGAAHPVGRAGPGPSEDAEREGRAGRAGPHPDAVRGRTAGTPPTRRRR